MIQNNLTALVSKLTIRDFYIDPVTSRVIATQDMFHPDNQSIVDIPHQVKFSDYRVVNGILVPFAVDEFVEGQHTSSIRLTQINFNSGLSDSDFDM